MTAGGDWRHVSLDEPLPVGRVVEGRKADGTVVVGRTRRPSNTLTDRDGVRSVVYHWRPLQRPPRLTIAGLAN